MPIDAIVAEIEDPVLEPADIHRIEGCVRDLRRFAEPLDPLRLLRPETVRIVDGAPVKLAILLRRAMTCLDCRAGGGISWLMILSVSFWSELPGQVKSHQPSNMPAAA
jgi:hypothetical protein